MSLLTRLRRPQTVDRSGVADSRLSLRDPLSPIPPSSAPRSLSAVVRHTVAVIGGMLATMTMFSIVNALTLGGVNHLFGLVPRSLTGAIGIVMHPLLHANFTHLGTNAIGLTLLGGLVMLREERDFWTVTALGVLVGGAGTWLVGRPALHIGASGVVFAYLGYLLTTGWFDRRLTSIALSLFAAVVWGSLLFGLSPLQSGISWELHTFGLIGGVLGARLRRSRANES